MLSALLVLSAQAVATTGSAPVEAYRISVLGGFYTGIHQSAALTRVRDNDSAKDVWVVERRSRTTLGPQGPVKTLVHDWIDGRSCPELRPVLLQIRPLARAKPNLKPPPFHGVITNVTTVRRDGALTRVKDYEGPVTRWWRTAQDKLQPCWRDEPVVLNGAALPAVLESDEAEKRFAPSDW